MKRRTRQALRITLPGLLAILTACTTLGPDHVMPESNVEAQWQVTDDPALQAGMEVNSEWWTLFHDPVLNRLVQMAYEQNLSLQAAGLRIMQARAQLGALVGDLYPQQQQGRPGGPGRPHRHRQVANDPLASVGARTRASRQPIELSGSSCAPCVPSGYAGNTASHA